MKITMKSFFLIIISICGLQAQQKNVKLKFKNKVVEVPVDPDLDLFQEFYESGKLKVKGFKKDGKSEGLWTYFDENGKAYYQIKYKNHQVIYTNTLDQKNGLKIIREKNDTIQ